MHVETLGFGAKPGEQTQVPGDIALSSSALALQRVQAVVPAFEHFWQVGSQALQLAEVEFG